MDFPEALRVACVLTPPALMAALVSATWVSSQTIRRQWRVFLTMSSAALVSTAVSLFVCVGQGIWPGVLTTTRFGLALALLVQLLGTVIAAFSARYLEGEANQPRYLGALATVLASVHLLLLADHWLVLIVAWAAVGLALQRLLCFYPDRPFALLAAHKKRIADRLADVMLLGATALAWQQVGSGSLTDLWAHIAQHGLSLPLQASAVLLVLAVTLRTALLPVHGWLIQVMEAPTPVSALLHAGVVAQADVARFLTQTPPARQKFVEITQPVVARSMDFRFSQPFTGLEVIEKAGTEIARDGDEVIVTPYDNCVIVQPSMRHLGVNVTMMRLGRLLDR